MTLKHLPFTVAALLLAAPAFAGEQTARIDVGEMTCPTCSFTVAASLRSVPTVQVVSFHDGDAIGEGVFVVTYDDQATDTDAIVNAVVANGYPARVAPSDNS